MWWSGDRSFEESIPTLHWRPDDRLTEEVLRFRVIDCLPHLVPVGGAGCTLLGVLVSMEHLAVFAMGSRFDLGVEIFTPRSGLT